MAKFAPPQSFEREDVPVALLPFRFQRKGGSKYLVSNLVGDFITLTEDEFHRVLELRIHPGDGIFEKALVSHLVSRQGVTAQHQLIATRLRSRMAFLQEPTPLHLFVVTLRCEHSCPYCQVSRQNTDTTRYDMSEETAQKSLAVALSCPTSAIKIEFQGGEPLLNMPLIEKIVAAAEAGNHQKTIQFVIATNLALLTDPILDFCKRHGVLLSTSLDGPPGLHNKNRPRPGGNSHELAIKGIKRAQQALGKDRVGALMTTTEASLSRVKEIVDEYLTHDLDGILPPSSVAVRICDQDQTVCTV